jgi:hypothetical protein
MCGWQPFRGLTRPGTSGPNLSCGTRYCGRRSFGRRSSAHWRQCSGCSLDLVLTGVVRQVRIPTTALEPAEAHRLIALADGHVKVQRGKSAYGPHS